MNWEKKLESRGAIRFLTDKDFFNEIIKKQFPDTAINYNNLQDFLKGKKINIRNQI